MLNDRDDDADADAARQSFVAVAVVGVRQS